MVPYCSRGWKSIVSWEWDFSQNPPIYQPFFSPVQRMQGSSLLDDFPLPSPLPFDTAQDDSIHPTSAPSLLQIHLPDLPPELTSLHRVEEDDDAGSSSGGGGSSKNDRSLGLLCQKFIMLLLVLPVRKEGGL